MIAAPSAASGRRSDARHASSDSLNSITGPATVVTSSERATLPLDTKGVANRARAPNANSRTDAERPETVIPVRYANIKRTR